MSARDSFDRMYRAVTIMEQCFDENRGTVDLTYKEMMYIYLIDFTDGCTVSKLAETIGVSLPAVTKRINSLEERGFVTRTRSEGDGRVKTIGLSEKGRGIARRMDDVFYPVLDRAVSRFSAEEVSAFCRVLEALSDEIEGSIKGGSE